MEGFASQQVTDLVLHTLRLTQQPLFNVQSFEPPFTAPDIVNTGCAILLRPSEEVIGVRLDIVALCLDCV